MQALNQSPPSGSGDYVDQRTSRQGGRSSAGLMGKTKCQDGCKGKKLWQEMGRASFGTNPTEHRTVVSHSELKHASFNKEEIYELRKEEPSKICLQRKDAIMDQAWKNINWQASKVALK
jgi:hypothetical protein